MDIYQIGLQQPVNFIQGDYCQDNLKSKHSKILPQAFQVVIAVSDELRIEVQGVRYRLERGDIFVVAPNQMLVVSDIQTVSATYFWAAFMGPWQVFQQEITQESLTATLEGAILVPSVWQLHNLGTVFENFSNLLQIVNANEYAKLRVNYRFTNILIEFSQAFLRAAYPVLFSQTSVWIRQIQGWMQSQLSADLTVHQVAVRFNLNVDYLNRKYRQATGQTVKQYLTTLKIRKAKSLLKHTNMIVRKVAEQAYFGDDKNFLKVFKKQTGLTPSAFRRQGQ